MREISGFFDEPTWKRLAGRVKDQQWPSGALYVVATPIGNLGDLSVRAWHALMQCDVIAAEDTRASRTLLDAWGVTTPLTAAHRHNEASAAQGILARLERGERVGLVSDAGAPAVSDPGARVVREVRQAGYPVIPIPGPSAVITALMASGATSDENPAFVFAGFSPSKATARQQWLRQWLAVPAPVVFFESPHRLAAVLNDLEQLCAPERELTIARELTKRFEQIVTLPVAQAGAWLASDSQHGQGEFVLVVHEAVQEKPDADAAVEPAVVALLDALLEVLSVRDAARVAAKATGVARDVLYALALQRKREE